VRVVERPSSPFSARLSPDGELLAIGTDDRLVEVFLAAAE
jgi:hypothetical protein